MHDGIVFFGLLGVAVAADSIGPARCVIVFPQSFCCVCPDLRSTGWPPHAKKERPRCCRSNKRSLT